MRQTFREGTLDAGRWKSSAFPRIFSQQDMNHQNLSYCPQGSGSDRYCLISARICAPAHKRVNAMLFDAGVFHACVQVVLDIYSTHYMSEYSLHTKPATTTTVNDAKEQRRKVLNGVFERRKLIYKNYMRKMQHNLNSNKIDLVFD
jgi:hypothetical protein